MRRATIFLIATTMALVLVYPASSPSAKSPDSKDAPTLQIITPRSGGSGPAHSGDDGDGDDLAGMKDRKRKPVGANVKSEVIVQTRLATQLWRMYLLSTLKIY